MNNFDYKKYSLEKLEEWVHDSLSISEASPKEIYDVIHKVVKENYYTYKHQASRAYELLALLNGNGYSYEDVMKERQYYEGDNYTEEELNAMCDKAASDEEKEKCREYNLREAEYYDKRAKLDAEVKVDGYSVNGMSHSEYYYDYTRNDPDRENPFTLLGWQNMNEDQFNQEFPSPFKKDKVKTWRLPVELDGASGEYFVSLPDDLQDASGIHEGDTVEWVDNNDGTFTMRKVTKPLKLDEC